MGNNIHTYDLVWYAELLVGCVKNGGRMLRKWPKAKEKGWLTMTKEGRERDGKRENDNDDDPCP